MVRKAQIAGLGSVAMLRTVVVVLCAFTACAQARAVASAVRRLQQSGVCGSKCFWTQGACYPSPNILPQLTSSISVFATIINASVTANANAQLQCCGATTATACGLTSSCAWDAPTSTCGVSSTSLATSTGIDFSAIVCPGSELAQVLACSNATPSTCSSVPNCNVEGSDCVSASVSDATQAEAFVQGAESFSVDVWGNCANAKLLRSFNGVCKYTDATSCNADKECAWDANGSPPTCSVNALTAIEVIIPNTGTFGTAFWTAFGSCYNNKDANSCVNYNGATNTGNPSQFSAPANLKQNGGAQAAAGLVTAAMTAAAVVLVMA